MNQLLSDIRKTYRVLSDQLEQLNDLAEQGARRIDDLEREISLSMPDSNAFKAFVQKPYLLRRIGADRHELIIPRFIGLRAGWPVRIDGEYLIFQVSRFIDLITPLPGWLRAELDYTDSDIRAYIDGDKLIVQDGDPTEIWHRFGGQRHFSARRGDTLYLKPRSKFQIMRDLVRQGVLPWQPQPVPENLKREPKSLIPTFRLPR